MMCNAVRFILLAAAVAHALAASAESAAPAPVTAPASTPEHLFAGNLTLVTDYRYRGISQTYREPAVQGGLDYVHASGFYLGTWMSNVSRNTYANGAGLEWDVFGGMKRDVTQDLAWDLGFLEYTYPGAHYNNPGKTKYNNLELYAALSWKWFALKYSTTLTDYFGVGSDTFGGACEDPRTGNAKNCFGAAPGGSRGSGYADLNFVYEFAEKTSLISRVGHQSVSHYGALSYTDYKLGVTHEYNGFIFGLAWIGSDARKGYYTASAAGNAGSYRILSRDTAVVSASRTF